MATNELKIKSNFMEQYLTADDKEKSETEYLDIKRKEKWKEELNELALTIRTELSRIFVTDEYSRDISVDCVWCETSGVQVSSIEFLSFTKHYKEFNTEVIGIMSALAPCEKPPKYLSVKGNRVTITISPYDKDFDQRMKAIFRLAKSVCEIRPRLITSKYK